MNKEIQLEMRNVFGVNRIYPICHVASALIKFKFPQKTFRFINPMESGESMSNKNIRIMQVVAVLFLNNVFILLAVADTENYLKIALFGGGGLLVIAGIYLARATEEMVNDFNARYREQEGRHR